MVQVCFACLGEKWTPFRHADFHKVHLEAHTHIGDRREFFNRRTNTAKNGQKEVKKTTEKKTFLFQHHILSMQMWCDNSLVTYILLNAYSADVMFCLCECVCFYSLRQFLFSFMYAKAFTLMSCTLLPWTWTVRSRARIILQEIFSTRSILTVLSVSFTSV